MMVPTEILSQQHFKTLSKLIANGPSIDPPKIALLTASTKKTERTEILKALSDGTIDMLIGTHSLFNKEVRFFQLGFVVVDEQHKFGVEQRQKIKEINDVTPHLLMMSATPIPRSLALVLQGTMHVSTIRTQLPGKQKVETFIIHETDAPAIEEMYASVVEDLRKGGRAYIVFPCIEESESENFAHLKSVEKEYEILKNTRFTDFQCGFVHGRLPPQQKNKAFANFANGETHVLISTTVIEVGVDVPEATTMIVYHPERYGLAQLHQLRGRVGRGKRSSKCYLIPPSNPILTFSVSKKLFLAYVERLEILKDASDGETIALEDLKHR